MKYQTVRWQIARSRSHKTGNQRNVVLGNNKLMGQSPAIAPAIKFVEHVANTMFRRDRDHMLKINKCVVSARSILAEPIQEKRNTGRLRL